MTRITSPARIVSAFALALLAGVAAAPAATAAPVSDSLAQIAHELSDGYAAKRPQGQGDTVAVFTFTCPPALAAQQVGYGVAELLVRELVTASRFKVVERTEMKKVLEEHALSLTGALDSDSCVRIGKLMGLKLMVLGSAEPLGNKYDVNARLVDVESGEVLATGFREVDRELFEADAKPYLLVPNEQALGIYFGAGYGVTASAKGFAGKTWNGTYGTASIEPVGSPAGKFESSELMIGLRFAPMTWLQFEGYYLPQAGYPYAGFNVNYSAPKIDVKEKSGGGGLAAEYVRKAGPRWRFLGGVGCQLIAYTHDMPGPNPAWPPYGTNGFTFIPDTRVPWVAEPFLEAGAEWKPMQRFGLLLNVAYLFASTQKINGVMKGGGLPDETVTLLSFNPGGLTPSLTTAFYF